jgi:hypothetical protein
MSDCPRSDPNGTTQKRDPSPYDTQAVEERAREWRAEAAMTTSATMRAFCLAQAEECERRVRLSLSTPIFNR